MLPTFPSLTQTKDRADRRVTEARHFSRLSSNDIQFLLSIELSSLEQERRISSSYHSMPFPRWQQAGFTSSPWPSFLINRKTETPYHKRKRSRSIYVNIFCLFLFLQEGLGSFCFIIFLTYCLSMAIFVFLVMPETKGKTMLQVMEEFNRLNYCGKKKQTILEQSNCSVVTVTRL